MILPDIDIANSTDEEIIAAYAKAGVEEDRARELLAALREPPDPRFPL